MVGINCSQLFGRKKATPIISSMDAIITPIITVLMPMGKLPDCPAGGGQLSSFSHSSGTSQEFSKRLHSPSGLIAYVGSSLHISNPLLGEEVVQVIVSEGLSSSVSHSFRSVHSLVFLPLMQSDHPVHNQSSSHGSSVFGGTDIIPPVGPGFDGGGHEPQSFGHDEQVSPPSHEPSPQ